MDSQAALKALDASEFKSKLVLSCFEALQALNTNRNVTLFWVPGHRDITGNKVEDALAREGAQLSVLNAERVSPPINATYKNISNTMFTHAERRWARLGSCKITKVMWGTYKRNNTKRLLTLNRSRCSLAVSIYTGHCLTQQHAFRMGRVQSDLCSRCRRTRIYRFSRAHYVRVPGISTD